MHTHLTSSLLRTPHLQGNIHLLLVQCINVLQCDDNVIRYMNALQTLCSLIRAASRKKLVDYSFDMLDVLFGFDAAELQMQVCVCVCVCV